MTSPLAQPTPLSYHPSMLQKLPPYFPLLETDQPRLLDTTGSHGKFVEYPILYGATHRSSRGLIFFYDGDRRWVSGKPGVWDGMWPSNPLDDIIR
eukprot:747862-Hanusia_phi.AAC.13